MSTSYTLRKEGIEVVKQLDTFNVNLIAQKIANRLCEAFPEHDFSRVTLFSSFSRLNMYLAKMNDDLCGAKYYYKDNSIFFNIKYSLDDADVFALHECLHYLQEQRDEKNNLIRLGLYNFVKNRGMALNEASVQLMTTQALHRETQNVTYYNLTIPTESIDYYPLECAIVKQMSYFTGTYPLYYSTIQSNDVFKNTFIAVSSKKAYDTIETTLDKMLLLENDLACYFSELKNYEDEIDKVKKLNALIDNTKAKIVELFFKCQNTIISHCFSYDLNNIHTLEDIKELKTKIYNFQGYIATNATYEFYNEFYRRLMEALDEKTAYIEANGPYELLTVTPSDLTVVNKVKGSFTLFRKIFMKLGLIRQDSF